MSNSLPTASQLAGSEGYSNNWIECHDDERVRRKLSMEQINPKIATRRSMKTHNEPTNGSVGKLHNYKVTNRFNGKTLNHKVEIVTEGKQESY